jgi:hypothetical protein
MKSKTCVHIVLTSLVALVLDYEISAPQDTLDKKKTLKVSSCRIFSWGTSQHSLPPWNTGTDLNHLLHYTVRLLSFRTVIIKSTCVKEMTLLLFSFRHTSLLTVNTDLHVTQLLDAFVVGVLCNCV